MNDPAARAPGRERPSVHPAQSPMGCSLGSIRASDDARPKAVSSETEADVPYSEDLQNRAMPRHGLKLQTGSDPPRSHAARHRQSAPAARARLTGARIRIWAGVAGRAGAAELRRDRKIHFAGFFRADARNESRPRARFPSAEFVNADFRSEDWTQCLTAPYDAVVSMQAVHEVRHKRHVPKLRTSSRASQGRALSHSGPRTGRQLRRAAQRCS